MKNNLSLFILLGSILLFFSKPSLGRDFENPHQFNPGDVMSADILNDLFGNIKKSVAAVNEEDLVGEWQCDSYLHITAYDESVDSTQSWEVGSEQLYATLRSTLTFSDDGDGTYSVSSSSPNPFLEVRSDAVNSSFEVKSNILFFHMFSGDPTGVLYEIRKISDTTVVLFPSLSDSNLEAVLFCDLQNLPPVNPKQLTATLSGSTVSLTWTDESDDEDNFKILRRDTMTGEFAEIGTATSASYTDTLTSDGKYWYRVVATNANGDSLGSNVAKVTLGDEDNSQQLRNELRMMKERMELIESELGGGGE